MTRNQTGKTKGTVNRVLWSAILVGYSTALAFFYLFNINSFEFIDGLLILLAAAFGFWLIGIFKES